MIVKIGEEEVKLFIQKKPTNVCGMVELENYNFATTGITI